MKIACLFVPLLLAAGGAVANDARPTFAEPVFQTSAACPLRFIAARSPQNQILSILRSGVGETKPEFLAVGGKLPKRTKSFCTMEIRFERPITTPQKLSIDMRSGEEKDADAVMAVSFRIGSQEHKTEYARGRWLDNPPTDARRYVTLLKPGAQSVRLTLSGMAKIYDEQAKTFFAFDTLDLCFVDPDRPQDCAASGQPNPSAASAPQ